MRRNSFYRESSISSYFSSINKYDLLTAEEEVALAKMKLKGNVKAKNRLINANLRLVVKIAKSYTNMEPSLIDLIQEGNLGLIKAAEKFDPSMGCRFSTYASYWIKHYVSRFISKKSRTIRIPIRKGDLFKKIIRTKEMLTNELGKSVTEKEIAAVLGIEEKAVKDIMEVFQPTVSLESPLSEDEFSLYEVVGDKKYLTPDDSISKEDLREELFNALNSLIDNEKNILKMRFGIDSDKPVTLKEVGSKFGISAETVRQIEVRAINKIKKDYPYLKDYMVN